MSLLLAEGGAAPTICYAALDYDDEAVELMRKNVSGQVAPQGQMNDRTTGAPLTTSVSIFVSGDNGAQTAGAGTLTHKGNGAWSYLPTQAETNYNEIAFTYTHASGVNKTYNVYTVSYDQHNTTSLGLSNLDAAISSRMASYTQPTGFLAATFPAGTVASTTNIASGTITTTTNLTNLPSITANWLTSAGIAAGALNGKGDWNIGKTGYSVSSIGTDVINAASLSADAVAEIVTGVLTSQMTESYAADGVAPTLAQSLFHLLGREYEFSISGDVLTVKKLDGITTAMTFDLTPTGGPYTGITRAS